MPASDSREALQVDDVSVMLGGHQVLDRVSLTVGYGDLSVIAGPNGAGKSTLLRALVGLLTPDTGQIACDGRQLHRLTRLERARRIAYVPQRSMLDAAVTVEDVVRQARFAHGERPSAEDQLVASALREVDMQDLAHRNYPSLSGGEQRLVLIARALCTGARIICLDEPTACLDVANRLRTLALLRNLARKGRAVLCVLHALDDVRRFSDHVVLLDQGRVAAAGAPTAVINANTIRLVYGVELLRNDAVGFRLAGEATP